MIIHRYQQRYRIRSHWYNICGEHIVVFDVVICNGNVIIIIDCFPILFRLWDVEMLNYKEEGKQPSFFRAMLFFIIPKILLVGVISIILVGYLSCL